MEYLRTPQRKLHQQWMNRQRPLNKNLHSLRLESTIRTQPGEISLVSGLSIKRKMRKKNKVKRGAASSRPCSASSRECSYSPRQCLNRSLMRVHHPRSRSSRNLYEAHSACWKSGQRSRLLPWSRNSLWFCTSPQSCLMI